MLNISKVESILSENDKLWEGMKRYKRIMDSLHWTDVSTDRDFQRAFNDFFVIEVEKE